MSETKQATKPFHRLRTYTGERSSGEAYTMGFVEFKKADAKLSTKEKMVVFEADVLNELRGAGRGDSIEIEYQKGENGSDPIIMDAQIVV